MSRTPLTTAATALLALATSTAAAVAGDAATIRVEPRPFYGATITLEAGVRVLRPLPSHKYVVINPGHKTPLGVNLTEVNETRNIHNHNSNHNSASSSSGGFGDGTPFFNDRRNRKFGGKGRVGGRTDGRGGVRGGVGGGHGGGFRR